MTLNHDPKPEAEPSRLAIFGGVYNNYLALEAAINDAHRRGITDLYCLGDLGAFGPHPARVFPLLIENNVKCIQGNYDNSIGNGLNDCQCGYTDPRDNHFAHISYRYTFDNTPDEYRQWMKELPLQRRLQIGNHRALLCHGSPRRMNEFLWESTTSTHFLDQLMTDYHADLIFATHTGIKWQRRTKMDCHFVNVGVLGRPENDGKTNVWYTVIHAEPVLYLEYVPVVYDHERLAREMQEEKLPNEFVETILTGWWTTCLEILPSKERKRGKH